MTKKPSWHWSPRKYVRILCFLVAGWSNRAWGAEPGAAPGGGCAALPADEYVECFRKLESNLSSLASDKKAPAAPKGGKPPAPPGGAATPNPPTGDQKRTSNRQKPPKVAPRNPSKPPAKPAAKPTPPISQLTYSGPQLADLEKWAEDAIAKRDALEKEQASPAKLEHMSFITMRIVGLILTIAGNCEPGARSRASGKASCAQTEEVTERIVERWLGLKSYKKLAKDLKARGFAEWEASAIFALAAQAHADIAGVRQRIKEAEHGLFDEKLIETIRNDVLPAAEKGLPDLQEALQKLPDLQRAEVMLVVLRAALPGARKRPAANILLVQHGADIPMNHPAANARRHFVFALKQILTATTGTDVCDAIRNCKKLGRTPDAQLHVTFKPSAKNLKVEAGLTLTHSGGRTPEQSPAKKAKPINIALGESNDPCTNEELVSRAVTAAWSLMKEIEWSYNNILGDVPHLAIESDVTQPLHSGVRVAELSRKPAELTYTGDVALVGGCQPEEFRVRLRQRIEAGFGRRLVSSPADTAMVKLTLTSDPEKLEKLGADPDVLGGALEAARPQLSKNNWCLAELTKEASTLYRALVYVSAPSLNEDAGSDLGTYLGARLALYAQKVKVEIPAPPKSTASTKSTGTAPVTDQGETVTTGPPPVSTTSSGWYALTFAGTPYLQDSRATPASRIIPSALDIGLLIAAGVSFGLAVEHRNDYAEDPRGNSMDSATRSLNLGIGFAIGWLGTRIVSGALYEGTNFWKKSRRKESPP